jgi:type IV pilus assembly protein PilQ
MTVPALILAVFLGSAQLISLDTKDMDLSDFCRLMANIANINLVLSPSVQGKVNLMVKDAPWDQVLDLVLKSHGLARDVKGNIMRIAPAAVFQAEQRQKVAATEECLKALPLRTRVYFLNYARAETVAALVSKMLSPRGSVITYTPRNALIVSDVERPEDCLR